MVVTFLIGSASIWAILLWRDAAEDLSAIYAQEARAERIRAELFLLIAHSREFLHGDTSQITIFMESKQEAKSLLDTLFAHTGQATERDHVIGLAETHGELVYIVEGLFERREAGRLNETQARERLDEIAIEATDDVIVLGHYYRQLRQSKIDAANQVGSWATALIGGVALAALVALGTALALMSRWLAQPISELSRATERISAGDFQTELKIGTHDEWGGLASDINRMSASLKTLQDKLREHERLAALGEVAAYAAHNIRNPLSGVRAAAQVALGSLREDQTETRDSLNEMIQSIDRLDVWVKRMLGFAKPLDYRPEQTDINQSLTYTLELARRSYAGKNIETRLDLDRNIPNTLADPALIEQSFNAVINNAFEAAPESGFVKVESELRIGPDSAREIVVRISDNGEGVLPELEGKLFKLFASGKVGGAGLGLAQAKRIFDTHGGTIKIVSERGAGCMVEATLPVVRKFPETLADNTENQTG